ncbi:MAG: hypothetical protein H6733_10765 [Alphaproteobacteria bacterium]|nr:hypothetical protein [Alphaproteobacteria bacterium]
MRPEALAIAAAVGLLHVLGTFAALDAWGWSWRARLWGEAPRGVAPTVIAVDEGTVAEIGPLPWDLDTWHRVGTALADQGVTDIVLADPWPRVIRVDAARRAETDAAPGAFRLVVPSAAWDDRPTPTLSSPDVPDWIVPARGSLALASPGGVPTTAVTLPDGGAAWWPCQHLVPCTTAPPGAQVLLRAADVPVLPLSTILAARDRFLAAGDAGVVIGLTADPWAERVATGPDHARLPWAIALARAVASARVAPLVVPAGPAVAVGWLISLYLLAGYLLAARQERSWQLLSPVLAVVAAVVGPPLGVLPPVAAGVLVALAPTVGRELALARASVTTVRRLALLVVRAASRAGTLRRRISSLDELLEVLADLTRSHVGEVPFTMLVVRPGSRRLVVHGGHKLVATQFRDGALRLDHPDVAASMEAWHGVEARGLLRDDRTCRLVALSQGDVVVAFWCIAARRGGEAPDARRVGRLARWVGERLALPELVGGFQPEDGVLPTSAADDGLDNLFLAADEERRRWMTAVQSVGHPLLVADVAGVISMLNPTMEQALTTAGLPRVRSVRELVVRAAGDDHIGARMRRLFVDARPIAVRWPDRDDDRLLVVRPVAVDQGDDVEMQPLLGYVAWLAPEPAVALEGDVLDTLTLDDADDATMMDLSALHGAGAV